MNYTPTRYLDAPPLTPEREAQLRRLLRLDVAPVTVLPAGRRTPRIPRPRRAAA